MDHKLDHCIDAAIAFANLPEQEGNGYTLRVELDNGRIIEGAVTSDSKWSPNVFLLIQPTGLGKPEEVFIDKRRVVSATVVW